MLMTEAPVGSDRQGYYVDPLNFLLKGWLSASSPYSSGAESPLLNVLNCLPTRERLSSLCEAFLENIAWFCRIVRRPQLLEELVPSVYKKLENPSERHSIEPHDLALLLSICALGAVGDLTNDPSNEEGFAYFSAAHAALSLKSIFVSPTLSTIQALVAMLSYVFISARLKNTELAWMTLNLAKSLAIGVRVHLYLDL